MMDGRWFRRRYALRARLVVGDENGIWGRCREVDCGVVMMLLQGSSETRLWSNLSSLGVNTKDVHLKI